MYIAYAPTGSGFSNPLLNNFLIFTFMGIRYASIHENPVRAEIVSNPVDYLYRSARDYVGEKGLVDIEFA